jgi:DNA-binding MarR family transcriptional regulator
MSDDAGRLAERFTFASDDFPELAALVWFNLTPAVRSQLGSEFDLSPPMFGVVGQRGKLCTHGHYAGEFWTVQFSMNDPDTVRFNRACERFKSLASQAKVPDIVGRPPADDARLLTLLAEAPGVEKWGRHPTDTCLWADPSAKRLYQTCPDWDDPNAVRQPARPDLGLGARVSSPVPSADVMRNGFDPTWWCAHLPNVFLRAAEWLRQPRLHTLKMNSDTAHPATSQKPKTKLSRAHAPLLLKAIGDFEKVLLDATPNNPVVIDVAQRWIDGNTLTQLGGRAEELQGGALVEAAWRPILDLLGTESDIASSDFPDEVKLKLNECRADYDRMSVMRSQLVKNTFAGIEYRQFLQQLRGMLETANYSDPQRRILRILLRAGATESRKGIGRPEIAKEMPKIDTYDGKKRACEAGDLSKHLEPLKTAGLYESKTGRAPKLWLTAKGRREAERLLHEEEGNTA